MRIAVDAARALRPERTGTERYAWEILRHLLRLPQAAAHRWRLYVDAADAAEQLARDEAGPLGRASVELCYLPPRRLWTHYALARAVRGDKPDVLFVPSHVVPFLPRLLLGALPRTVVTIHDLGYRYEPEAHTRAQRLYLDWSTRWSVRAAARVIAVSHATADDLRRFYQVPQRKITVVHEAAAPAPALDAAAVQEARVRYGLDRPYALYVGTIQPRKNLARLLDAYACLEARGGADFDLVLAGKAGWLSDDIYAKAAALGNRVRFPGYVPEADRAALMQGALFFTFPSLFEGFGLPVLEAQTMGVPVLTSENSSLPEVAGDAALLVDPTDVDAIADAMLRLSRDAGLRAALIEAGHANVRRFSWEKAARETLAVLEAAARGA
jgi:glycosyltransferase involved in cell wall biosynthesis